MIQSKDRDNGSLYCRNCGVEVVWLPVVNDSRIYCCQDCFYGLPCDCTAISEMDEDRLVDRTSLMYRIVIDSS